MNANSLRQRALDIIGQSDCLNRVAFARMRDANESRLIVHGIMTSALKDQTLPSTVSGMDIALLAAIAAHRSRKVIASACS